MELDRGEGFRPHQDYVGLGSWLKAGPTIGLSKISYSKDHDYLADNPRASMLSRAKLESKEKVDRLARVPKVGIVAPLTSGR
jgi:hypothetical protein